MRAHWRKEILPLDEALARVRVLGENIRNLRKDMPEDAPYHGAAFELASLIGRVEAELTIQKQKEERPALHQQD